MWRSLSDTIKQTLQNRSIRSRLLVQHASKEAAACLGSRSALPAGGCQHYSYRQLGKKKELLLYGAATGWEACDMWQLQIGLPSGLDNHADVPMYHVLTISHDGQSVQLAEKGVRENATPSQVSPVRSSTQQGVSAGKCCGSMSKR